LYFLQGGENMVDPELGSNGVGKSTIWGILCWVLFGKFPDGLKAGDLKSWASNEKGYYAKLWLERDLIVRTWKPNNLTINGEVVEQKELEQRIGISFDTFISSVVLSQGGNMFFDLPPPKKLSMFTSLLGLENWIEYSKQAQNAANDMTEDIFSVEKEISKLGGMLDSLNTEELQDESKSWRSNKQTKIERAKSKVEDFTHDFLEIGVRISKSKKYRKKLDTKSEAAEKKIVKFDKVVTELKKDIENYCEDLKEKRWAVATVKKTLDYFETHMGKTCMECGQKISKVEAEKQIVILKKELRKAKKEMQPISDEMDTLLVKGDSLQGIVDKELSEGGKIAEKRKKAFRIYEELLHDEMQVKTAMHIAEDRLQEARSATNPYRQLLQESKDKESKLLIKVERKEKKAKALELKQTRIRYWVQGFKDIRLHLIKEALLQFELETNAALVNLGLSEQWKINYTIEKETKRGSTIMGFNVYVRSPHTTKQIPFAAWSGGERQRLRIAGSMGFMSLITDRSGIDFGLEVYDEPTQHLSPEGIDSLLSALNSRARQTDKRIWLVDHHTLDYGDFTGHFLVNKDDIGRSMLCEL